MKRRATVCAPFSTMKISSTRLSGDGSLIPDAVLDHIGEVYEKICVRIPWQAGDVIMLDNMLAAHARDPYEGPRQIVVAMGRITSDEGAAKS